MKYFAFFLPQFHEIPENNKWWGEGFTEWTNVRKAKSLFKGHVQPIHPINDNYYNLLDKKTVEWQSSLMKEYLIDGMIYYHYWFNGKLLLEKPAENLLKWKDISQKFFFCWANHAWKKSWNGTQEILMPMEYGELQDWERHYDYLRPFFSDERYEKIDNKPLLMLFVSDFEEKKEMIEYFDLCCKRDGFAGIAIIETYHDDREMSEFKKELTQSTRYIFYREPVIQMNIYLRNHNSIIKRVLKKIARCKVIHRPEIIDGNILMRHKLSCEPMGYDVAHGIWFEWDNTPRHKQRGYVISPYDKDYFLKYTELIKKDDYMFINAWNEWCEGMILEPSEEKGYKYLNWIKEAKNSIYHT